MPTINNGRIEMLFDMVQTANNNVLEMAKENTDLKASQISMGKELRNLTENMSTLISSMRSLSETIHSKMTPDRCAHMHDDLKKQIFREMKDGAKGWGTKILFGIKVVAYISAAFGGSAIGANALGLFH